MKSYDKMLDELYAKLPNKLHKFERFEMPKVDVIIKGKNKTVWLNFKQIAELLRRDINWMMRYFSKEFGSPVSLQGNQLVIQRRLLPRIIQKKLEFFIKEYVLCHECGKIDTNIINSNGYKVLVCEACGARRTLGGLL